MLVKADAEGWPRPPRCLIVNQTMQVANNPLRGGEGVSRMPHKHRYDL